MRLVQVDQTRALLLFDSRKVIAVCTLVEKHDEQSTYLQIEVSVQEVDLNVVPLVTHVEPDASGLYIYCIQAFMYNKLKLDSDGSISVVKRKDLKS